MMLIPTSNKVHDRDVWAQKPFAKQTDHTKCLVIIMF